MKVVDFTNNSIEWKNNSHVYRNHIRGEKNQVENYLA